jgi:hypothetical protein
MMAADQNFLLSMCLVLIQARNQVRLAFSIGDVLEYCNGKWPRIIIAGYAGGANTTIMYVLSNLIHGPFSPPRVSS